MNETLTDRQTKILAAVEEYDQMISKPISVSSFLQFQNALQALKDRIYDTIYPPDKVDLVQPIEMPVPQGYMVKPGTIVPLVKCDE